MNQSWGYASDQRKRGENQDSYGVFNFSGMLCAIVCDGMGGHAGGAYASRLAVRSVAAFLEENLSEMVAPMDVLRQALEHTNQVIYETSRKNHRLMGMGTTAVVAIVHDGVAHIAHVGDSRCYLVSEGQALALTRDHTMVNLFVDAELLTPEDAATHPEAHVLSRSLGVERQVDVEVQDPFELAANDVLVLCSDGVHGVVTDADMTSVDWADPVAAVQHVINIVQGRDGDDNATAVAVRMASGNSAAFTALPELGSVEEPATAGSSLSRARTIVPLDEDEIAPYDNEHDTVDGGFVTVEAPQPSRVAPMPPQPTAVNVSPGPTPPPVPAQAAPLQAKPAEPVKKAPPPPSTGSSKRVLVIGGLMAVVILGATGLGIAALLLSGGRERPVAVAPAPVTPLAAPVLVADAHEDAEPAAPAPPSETPVLVEDAGEDGAPIQVEVEGSEDTQFFKADIPAPPRRLPNRPLQYTQAPPGGPVQFNAIQTARARDCRGTLDVIRGGMRQSMDNAVLYAQAWACFNDVHQRPLTQASVADAVDAGPLLVHFEGGDESEASQSNPLFRMPSAPLSASASSSASETDWSRFPAWYRPATGGLEYRLQAWSASTMDDRFAVVMSDLLGEPTVADQLVVDLMLEGELGQAYASLEAPTPEQVTAWARRVYIFTAARQGKLGKLITLHRPELAPRLDAMANNMLRRPADAEADVDPGAVPLDVRLAWDVARGAREVPDRAKAPKAPKDTRPKEPELGSGAQVDSTRVYK